MQGATLSNSATNAEVSKRRKFNYFVPDDIKLGNRDTHWVTFTNGKRRYEQCLSKGIKSHPYSKCIACLVYLCVNEKRTVFKNIIILDKYYFLHKYIL